MSIEHAGPDTPPEFRKREPQISDVTTELEVPNGRQLVVPRNLEPLDRSNALGEQTLITALPAGDTFIGLVRIGESSTIGVVDMHRSGPNYTPSDNAVRMPEVLGWVTPENSFTLTQQVVPTEQQATVGVLPTGEITVIGVNGTTPNVLLPKTGQKPDKNPFSYMLWLARDKPPQERQEAQTASPEFIVGDASYKIEGRNPDGKLTVESMGSDGRRRVFFVYESQSEGSLRVSQGKEFVGDVNDGQKRFMKGAELSPDFQYTQDTQLHPDFAKAIKPFYTNPNLPTTSELAGTYAPNISPLLLQDFEQQVAVAPLTPEVDGLLHKLKANSFSRAEVMQLTHSDQAPIMEAGLRSEIDMLNQALQRSNVIPDFRHPIEVTRANHPVLGSYTIESYVKNTNGRLVEWHIARDQAGRVWIDRIRNADSPPTPYGTDRNLLYSGVLTSKPLDYKQQCDGLPTAWRRPMNETYDDITPFLGMLAPIQAYRQQKAQATKY